MGHKLTGRKYYNAWTKAEADIAARMFAELKHTAACDTYAEIGTALKRSSNAVSSRYHQLGPTFWRADGSDAPSRIAAPIKKHAPACVQALADRDRRASLQRPTLTAEFFGDPLPGYSALDQRRGGNG